MSWRQRLLDFCNFRVEKKQKDVLSVKSSVSSYAPLITGSASQEEISGKLLLSTHQLLFPTLSPPSRMVLTAVLMQMGRVLVGVVAEEGSAVGSIREELMLVNQKLRKDQSHQSGQRLNVTASLSSL